jgi:hypothetical protein
MTNLTRTIPLSKLLIYKNNHLDQIQTSLQLTHNLNHSILSSHLQKQTTLIKLLLIVKSANTISELRKSKWQIEIFSER